VFPAGNRERRGVIIDVVTERPLLYFKNLVEEIKSPAFAPALLAYFQRREVDYDRLRLGLDTAALREQQDYSADVVQQWWKMTLEEGTGVGVLPWEGFVPSD